MPRLLNATGVRDIIEYSFVPWGNAYYATSACGKGPYSSNERHCWFSACVSSPSPQEDCFGGTEAIVAQHGDKEKHVNLLEACAIKLYPAWSAHWPFIQCLEGSYEESAGAWNACARRAGVDFVAIDSCASGPDGAAAAAAEAKATPDHPGVPYILVDGQPTDADADRLLTAVCTAYKGERPEGCKGHVSGRSSLWQTVARIFV